MTSATTPTAAFAAVSPSVDDPWGDLAPKRLSPSRASDYKQCPRMFRFKTIDRLPSPSTLAQARGVLVHAVLESLYGLPAHARTVEAAVAAVPDHWEALLGDESRDYAQMFPTWEVSPEELMGQAEALLRRYFTMEDPTVLGSPGLEHDMRGTVAGVPLRGIIDRVDTAPDGRVRVVDYKTGRAPSPRFREEALWQLRFYAVMWRHLYGAAPSRLRLVYLGERNPGFVEHSPSEAELDQFEAEIAGLWGEINAAFDTAHFPPRTSKLCAWCDFQPLCPEGASITR